MRHSVYSMKPEAKLINAMSSSFPTGQNLDPDAVNRTCELLGVRRGVHIFASQVVLAANNL
jgi:hypothetical protein